MIPFDGRNGRDGSMTLLLLVLLWLTASIPVAVITGRTIGREATHGSPPLAPELSDELLSRLRHIELEEIPRVRLAIEGWVDDPHLSTELRELRAEAERLRRVLRAADPSPSDPDMPVVA